MLRLLNGVAVADAGQTTGVVVRLLQVKLLKPTPFHPSPIPPMTPSTVQPQKQIPSSPWSGVHRRCEPEDQVLFRRPAMKSRKKLVYPGVSPLDSITFSPSLAKTSSLWDGQKPILVPR